MKTMAVAGKDEHGRPIADDGWPSGGLARIAEAQAFLGLSRSKIYGLLCDGSLSAVRFGKSKRIRWSDLRAVVAGVGEEVVR